jgi:hypothetical protein
VGPLCEDQLPHLELTALHHAFGFSTDRFDNLKYIEPDVLLYVAGNYLVKLDMRESPPTRSYVMGVDGRGIGAFVIHPTLPLVVVGEKGCDPNIYVFEYPSWEVSDVGPCYCFSTSFFFFAFVEVLQVFILFFILFFYCAYMKGGKSATKGSGAWILHLSIQC